MLRLMITTIALERKSDDGVRKTTEPESAPYTSQAVSHLPSKTMDRRCSSQYLKKSAA